jgi:hypothetical protein
MSGQVHQVYSTMIKCIHLLLKLQLECSWIASSTGCLPWSRVLLSKSREKHPLRTSRPIGAEYSLYIGFWTACRAVGLWDHEAMRPWDQPTRPRNTPEAGRLTQPPAIRACGAAMQHPLEPKVSPRGRMRSLPMASSWPKARKAAVYIRLACLCHMHHYQLPLTAATGHIWCSTNHRCSKYNKVLGINSIHPPWTTMPFSPSRSG